MAGKELHPGEAVATTVTTGDAERPLACSKIPGCYAVMEELQQVYQNPLLAMCCSCISSQLPRPKETRKTRICCRNFIEVSYCCHRSLCEDVRYYWNTGL